MSNKEIVTGNGNQQENSATEYYKEAKRQSAGKTVVSVIAILSLSGLLAFQMNINRQNEKEWRELFSSYDYVSQDGEGYNYYNSRIGGDVNNGAENTD